MPKAIETRGTLTVGHAGLGFRSGVPGSVRQQVHDGDTINVRAIGNFGVRFLGIDTPEISFELLDQGFRPTGSAEWEAFLTDPFQNNLPPFEPALTPELTQYLRDHTGAGTATNHRNLAEAAENVLEELVIADMQVLGQDEETFRFFLVFAHEITDGFGRFLCFINRDQPNRNNPEPRPLSYNERLLERGASTPYFIWPNINPFLRGSSVADAVLAPGTAAEHAENDGTLRRTRQFVKKAREDKKGVFRANDPLRLEPFELRFLGRTRSQGPNDEPRRRPPGRWLIDLSKNDDVILQPQNYFTVPNPEDRLFIPVEYLPLFVEAGWRRQK